MDFNTSTISQWTELGQQLSSGDAEAHRQRILESLDHLENRVQVDLRNPTTTNHAKLEALEKAIQTAREIAQTVHKTVDLSAL